MDDPGSGLEQAGVSSYRYLRDAIVFVAIRAFAGILLGLLAIWLFTHCCGHPSEFFP